MTISEYKLKKDTFRAPKMNVMSGEFQSYFTYYKGQSILGYVDESTGVKLLVTENSYVIPLSSLTFVRDIEIDGVAVDYAEDGEAAQTAENKSGEPAKTKADKIEAEAIKVVKEGRKQTVEIPQEYRAQMDKIKNTDIVNSIVKKSRNSVNGMLIGGLVGFVIAIATKNSKLMGIVLGTTAGGLIGYGLTGEAKKAAAPKKEEPKKTEPKTEEQDGKGKKD